jgi:hypothetical protein
MVESKLTVPQFQNKTRELKFSGNQISQKSLCPFGELSDLPPQVTANRHCVSRKHTPPVRVHHSPFPFIASTARDGLEPLGKDTNVDVCVQLRLMGDH